MAISDRITSIEEHIKESYQELEGIGIDTTEVDKNLENIPKLIDGYWETLPKVTGEGTSITLDNTKEGKMKIDLKGNTSQETTTGKNLFNSIYYKNKEIYTETISISTGNLYCTKLYLKPNTTYTISEALNNWSLDGGWIFVVADTNNQIIRFLQNRQRDYQTTPTTFTTNSEGYVYIGHRYGFVEGTTDRILTFLDTVNIQIEEGNTATSFEEYTGGPSPNPDYPQDIHVVSGDNSIEVVGKNLYNGEISATNQRLSTSTGGGYATTGWSISSYVAVQPNTTYTLSTNDRIFCDEYTENKAFIKGTAQTYGVTTPITITTTSTTKYLRFDFPSENVSVAMIELGSNATTYEAYKGASYPINLGNIELCKIGDYQDSIVKDNGKWYLNKQIGKIVLDGSENWAKGSSRPFYTLLINDILRLQSAGNNATLFCNYLSPSTPATIWENNINGITNLDDGNAIRIRIQDNPYTITTFKEWLNDVKPVVYYVLATPTYTEITDSTLLSQLEALNGAKSYNPQTNVSQENNDNASILNASALSE